MCFSSSASDILISCPGQYLLRMLFLGIEMRAGGEKRTLHPLGSSEEKGRPEPPPVLSPNWMGDLGPVNSASIDKIIGCTIGTTVGQDNYFFCQRILLEGSR